MLGEGIWGMFYRSEKRGTYSKNEAGRWGAEKDAQFPHLLFGMNVLGDFGLDSILCYEFLQGQVIAYPLMIFIRNIREKIFFLLRILWRHVAGFYKEDWERDRRNFHVWTIFINFLYVVDWVIPSTFLSVEPSSRLRPWFTLTTLTCF